MEISVTPSQMMETSGKYRIGASEMGQLFGEFNAIARSTFTVESSEACASFNDMCYRWQQEFLQLNDMTQKIGDELEYACLAYEDTDESSMPESMPQ